MDILNKRRYFWPWTLGHLVWYRKQSFAAVTVITLSFLILEIFLLLFLNLQSVLDQWIGQVRLIVYLKDSLSQEEIKAIEEKLKKGIDYQELQYISKDQLWKEFKRDFGIDELPMGMDYNLLPATFIMKLKEPLSSQKKINETTTRLQKISGVEEVEYGGISRERVKGIFILFKSITIIMGTVLSLAILTIAVSTFKSSLEPWKTKIDILQMSGVSPWLVKGPAALAGSIQGLLSSCLSLGILFVLYKSYLYYLFYWHKDSYRLLGSVSISFLSPVIISALIGGATLLGSWSIWLFLQKDITPNR